MAEALHAGIEVFAQPDWPSGTIEFFVRRRGMGGFEFLLPADPADGTFFGPRWEVLTDARSQPEPSFRIERDIWTAMLQAAQGLVEPNAASERHLADAIAVRDRMIALVEHHALHTE